MSSKLTLHNDYTIVNVYKSTCDVVCMLNDYRHYYLFREDVALEDIQDFCNEQIAGFGRMKRRASIRECLIVRTEEDGVSKKAIPCCSTAIDFSNDKTFVYSFFDNDLVAFKKFTTCNHPIFVRDK